MLLEGHPHHVGAAGAGRAGKVRARLAKVPRLPQDPLRHQEPHGQFIILAGGAHGDGEAQVLGPLAAEIVQANFQRFFDGQIIRGFDAAIPPETLDGDGCDGWVHSRPSSMHYL